MKVTICQHAGVFLRTYKASVPILHGYSTMHLQLGERLGKRRNALVLLAALALCTGFPKSARADFVGYYDLGNWSVTNMDYLFNAGTNGSASTSDGGRSVFLKG